MADTVKRFKELGVDVILTECTVTQNDILGSKSEQEQKAAEVWGKVPVAALGAGASELTIFTTIDTQDGSDSSGIYDFDYNPKPARTALAQGLASLPDATTA